MQDDLISATGADAPRPILVRLSDVEPQPVSWLWKDRIPAGKLSILAGDPTGGKSTMTCDFSSRVTRGAPWPDGSPGCAPGSVIILSAEDDAADTLRPRLDAHEADVSRVHLLRAISEGGKRRTFCLDSDLEMLTAVIRELGDVRMVVIDPLSAYLGRADSHQNSHVRAILEPLSDMCSELDVAVVGVHHLNKGTGSAMYRLTGSLAFCAAPRAVWAVSRDQVDVERRVMSPIKLNLCKSPGGMSFTIDDAGRLQWDTTPVYETADGLLGAAAARPEETWLRKHLEGGQEILSDEVYAAAAEVGFKRAVIWKAKDKVGVVAKRTGFGQGGKWAWYIPERPAQRRAAEQARQTSMDEEF